MIPVQKKITAIVLERADKKTHAGETGKKNRTPARSKLRSRTYLALRETRPREKTKPPTPISIKLIP
jgi:hypothetical protein